MKKHCGWKKSAAFLMSMALVTGITPANVGCLLNNGIVANAADAVDATDNAKVPAVGTLFKEGDTISAGEATYFLIDDDPDSGYPVVAVTGNVTLAKPVYESGQYVWKTGVQFTAVHTGFYITSEYSETDPEGFYITGGKGTSDSPFTIGLTAPKFNGKNITLNDGISLNFIVGEVTDETVDDFKVKLSGICDEKGTLQSIEKKTINGQEVFCATANVTANNMDSVITADLYYGDSTTAVDTAAFSVNSYLDSIDNSGDEKLDNIVAATRQYGAVSAAYFGKGEMPQVADHSAEILKDSDSEFFNTSFKPTMSEGSLELGNYTTNTMESSDAIISLVLNSKLSVRLYTAKYEQEQHPEAAYDIWTFNPFNITDPVVISAIEGANGKYCFEIPGITPTQLGTLFNINYLGTDYKFTPLSWAYRVMSKDGAPVKDVTMANALYEYYIAATNYVG